MIIFDLSNNVLNNIIKSFVMNICTFLIVAKIVNLREISIKNKLLVFIGSTFFAFCYAIIDQNYNQIYALLALPVVYGTIVKYILNKKYTYSLVVTLISYAICFSFSVISTIFAYSFLILIFSTDEVPFFDIFIIDIFIIIFTLLFIHIKKIRNGIYFLRDEEKVNNMGSIGILISIILIIFFIFWISFAKNNNILIFLLLFIVLIVIGILIFVWIRQGLKYYYKNRMKDRNISLLEIEAEKLKKEIANLSKENYFIAKENHKINHKLDIWRTQMVKLCLQTKIVDKELSLKLDNFLKEIDVNSSSYINIIKSISKDDELPLTNIFAIDNLLFHMFLEAKGSDISFNLKINESINYIIENFISEDLLVTLLCDHIKDAIIAINYGNNSYKSIIVILGKINNYYGISIYDTGKEFEIDTLVNLGLRPVTTHKDTGGTGYGFMTTFDNLNKTKASLVIEEKKVSKTNYTKSVSIIFDNKNKYRIKSYRLSEIKEKDLNNRIIIEK